MKLISRERINMMIANHVFFFNICLLIASSVAATVDESSEEYVPKKVDIKFFTSMESKPERIIVFNTERYGNWSEWSDCLSKECIELRNRKCLDESWREPAVNKIHTANCLSKYYAEKRTCRDEKKCNSYIGAGIVKNLQSECGKRTEKSESIIPKIMGGKTSEQNSWPWVVRLSIKPRRKSKSQTFCGGTLIAPQWILTAAHCLMVENKRLPVGKLINLEEHMTSTVYAHVGDFHQVNTDTHEQYYKIKKVILHPRYHRRLLANGDDIALAYLEKPVEISTKVNFACLSLAETILEPGTKCYALGWGKTGKEDDDHHRINVIDLESLINSLFKPLPFHFGRFPYPNDPWYKRRTSYITDEDVDDEDDDQNKLQEVELPVVSIDKCREAYANLDERTHICAGSRGRDTCAGDSGGGLYCQLPDSDNWFVAGVTSFGLIYGCGTHPGIYTSVQAHQKWIENSLALVQ